MHTYDVDGFNTPGGGGIDGDDGERQGRHKDGRTGAKNFQHMSWNWW